MTMRDEIVPGVCQRVSDHDPHNWFHGGEKETRHCPGRSSMLDSEQAGAFASEFVERLQSVAPEAEEIPAPRAEWHDRWEKGIPWRFQACRLEHLEQSVHDEIRVWTDASGRATANSEVPTANLVLLGPVGTGKTHTGIAALHYLACYRGCSFAFFPVVELLDKLRPNDPGGFDPFSIDRLAQVRVLMLDDLGAEKASEWTVERLYAIVNRRWLEGRPTIVTTNLPVEELEQALDPRLYSRLVDGAVALRLTGADRRRS